QCNTSYCIVLLIIMCPDKCSCSLSTTDIAIAIADAGRMKSNREIRTFILELVDMVLVVGAKDRAPEPRMHVLRRVVHDPDQLEVVIAGKREGPADLHELCSSGTDR